MTHPGGGAADENDPFAGDDPLDAVGGAEAPAVAEEPAEEANQTDPSFDEFDALGFDTGFGMDPGGLGDNDDTPPGGIYVGEEVSVLDAASIGRALAEADGTTEDYSVPDLGGLAQGLVGIDVGAAVAVIAMFNKDGKHEIVPNADDELNTPVQIFFDDDGEQLVGKEAREMAPSEPKRAVLDLKAAIFDESFRLEAGAAHGGELHAEDVVTVLIKRLLSDAEAYSGSAPTHVALAAPVWFEQKHREILRHAVEKAGVTLVGIADEAFAATVPFSLRLPDLNERRALVFDLGHAALSVAIVRCAAGDIDLLAQAGDTALGSHAWDELLAAEAARKFEQKFGVNPLEDEDGTSAFDLRLRAEDAKKSLSQRAQCTLVVSDGGNTLKIGFTRRGFEEAAKPLLEGARQLMEKVRKEAGIEGWADLDAVIMAGGGTRTPAVRRLLIKVTGRETARGISPEDGVAVGSLYWGSVSDTASPSPTSGPSPTRSKTKRCCLIAAAVTLLLVCLISGYAVYVSKAIKSPAALEFQPFQYRPLERSLLTAKFEFLELPSRLLTGGSAPVELVLNERELNALLFGEAGHSDGTEKARVLIQPGDRLLLEYSKPAEPGAEPEFINVTCLLSLSLGPGVANLTLHEAKIGTYELGGFTKGWLENKFQTAFEERYQRDSRLRRIRALSLESGRVRVTYQPETD